MDMKKYLRRIMKKIIPYKEYCKLTGDFYKEELEAVKQDIFTNKELEKCYEEEIKYLKKEGGLVIFPYQFTEKYRSNKIAVYLDEETKMKYVIHNEKRLFFPREWNERMIKNYYNGLLIEQDLESPHRYFTDTFKIERGGVFVDVGSAEAMSSLECIEDASEVYIFESDPKWIEALQLTFQEYNHKCHIIPKFVDDYNGENTITLDEALKDSFGKEFFIKLDLNGLEWKALYGSPQLLNTQKIKVAGCVYHHQEDEAILWEKLISAGFQCELSKGYMLFLFSEMKPPYFRRGLIRARNDQ